MALEILPVRGKMRLRLFHRRRVPLDQQVQHEVGSASG